MIKGALLDYDGVMTSVNDANMPPSERLADVLDISGERANELFSAFWSDYLRGKITDDELWSWLGEQTGKTVSQEGRAIWATWDHLQPLPEMKEFVASLQNEGLPVGLLTNVTPTTEQEVRDGGGYDGFDFTVKSCEVGYAKPDPEIYEIAMERFGELAPSEVVFVDDRERCLVPARALGMKAIRSLSSHQVIADVQHLLTT